MIKKRVRIITFQILNGQTTSSEIDISNLSVYGISTPAALTGTTITFSAAAGRNGTFQTVYGDDGTAISITVAASRYVALNNKHIALRGVQFLKVISGSSEGADRTLYLHCVEE